MAKKRTRKQTSTPIQASLEETSCLKNLVQKGLQGVESGHRNYIDQNIRTCFKDSVDIDSAFQAQYPNENRWDYLLGHRSGKVFGLEPHSASNSEIKTVINKKEAAKTHLRSHLKMGARIEEWFWVASGKVDFLPIEKANIRLDNAGITFVGKVLKQKHLD